MIPEFILFYSAKDSDGVEYIDAVSFSSAAAMVEFLCTSSITVLYVSRLEDCAYS